MGIITSGLGKEDNHSLEIRKPVFESVNCNAGFAKWRSLSKCPGELPSHEHFPSTRDKVPIGRIAISCNFFVAHVGPTPLDIYSPQFGKKVPAYKVFDDCAIDEKDAITNDGFAFRHHDDTRGNHCLICAASVLAP